MSILTKVFIVLSVVLNLLLVPALVVFLNKTDNFDKLVKSAKEEAGRAQVAQLAAQQEAIAARGQLDLGLLQAGVKAKDLDAALNASIASAGKAQGDLAASQSALQKALADAATAQTAVQGMTATVDAQQKAINDSAVKLAGMERDRGELSTRVAGLIKEVDGDRAMIRRMKEEIVDRDQKIDDLTHSKTVSTQSDKTQLPGMESVLNLRGVVKAKRNINGTEYATISLGSAQNVTKGMEFKVIDGGNFLGYLTVDSVETDESVGHLNGPNLQLVRPGSQVRTQF